MEITLNLSPSLFERIILRASLKRQDMEQAAMSLLQEKDSSEPIMLPVESLPDNEVLELSHLRMSEQQGERMSQLSALQRERRLSEKEESEMSALMQVYNQLLVYKSEALVEAVNRGLRPPLSS